MTVNIWKIIFVHCGEETNINDPRSYEHYCTSSWNKTWNKIQTRTGFEPMTSATPVQRSVNWANELTGSMLGPNKPSKWWIMTYLFFIYFIPIVIKLSYALFLAVVEKLLYNKVLVSDVFLCTDQAPVVRRSDNAIHWINLYPVDNALRFAILSTG